jgi:hypothetical protein
MENVTELRTCSARDCDALYEPVAGKSGLKQRYCSRRCKAREAIWRFRGVQGIPRPRGRPRKVAAPQQQGGAEQQGTT